MTSLPPEAFDALDDILDDLRTRYDETPQWEFCEGFMVALICPADARSIMRENARQLTGVLEKALAKTGLSKTTRAHYADALDSLNAALKASMQRATP